jgi:hypothetical protein
MLADLTSRLNILFRDFHAKTPTYNIAIIFVIIFYFIIPRFQICDDVRKQLVLIRLYGIGWRFLGHSARTTVLRFLPADFAGMRKIQILR